jgi:hypothetical protein
MLRGNPLHWYDPAIPAGQRWRVDDIRAQDTR